MTIQFATIKELGNPKAVMVYCIFIAMATVGVLQMDNYQTIGSDGAGYYAYLPAVFIHGNLDNLEEGEIYTNTINGRVVNKYFIGTALLISPFFSVAYMVSTITDYASDGYSFPFQFGVAIGALFYLWLGLWLLNELLKTYRISPIHRSITIMAIVLGTNLFYYGAISTSMSHVYSFAMITGFLYNGRNFLRNSSMRYVYGLVFFMALVVLIRPVNALVIFLLPFLADSKGQLILRYKFLLTQKKTVLMATLLGVVILFIQLITWKVQSGHYFIWSYEGEGFYWNRPRIFSYLFSFKKGLFIYTPLLLLSIVGMLVGFWKNSFLATGLTLMFVLITYVLSSWWSWEYGDSFGQRSTIDFYAIYALCLGLLLHMLGKTIWIKLVNGVIILVVAFNLIQSYQFFNHIIHPSAMTAEKYAYIFLKTDKKYAFCLGGKLDLPPYSKKETKLVYSTINDFEGSYEGWNGGRIGSYSELCSGKYSGSNSCFYKDDEFGVGLVLQNKAELVGKGKLFLELRVKKMLLDKEGMKDAKMVLSTEDKEGQVAFYTSYKLEEVPSQNTCEWVPLYATIITPMLRNTNEKLSIYIWNSGHQNFVVDDFEVAIYRVD